ncbi:homeobox-leucine zipper protein [Salvia divinorum]|uniref:Homeobox-leucine zipper protein n=1 Tax=Salvia divinorum TaxID=28513 RepID=A0ABD1FVP9_SALDI
MELGLSLGDASKSLGFLKDNNNSTNQDLTKANGFDFCMSLGLGSENLERGKAQENDDEDDDISAEDGSDDNNQEETPLQLNLLPLAPVPRLWSSDNGSSENGSSGAAAKGLDVNRMPAAEEASSANKREFEGAGNDNDDDDDNALNTRKKLRLSKEQSAFLEESFKEHNTLNPKQKLALAKQLNLRARQVEVWFQNRRARTKLKQTEVDCEYLKRCCETLTEENRRLHKELQELRALKTSNPFYMQLPATTLTMCPSCERVASTTPSAAAAKPDSNIPKAIPFPLARPRFYPFPQTPAAHPNQPAAS